MANKEGPELVRKQKLLVLRIELERGFSESLDWQSIVFPVFEFLIRNRCSCSCSGGGHGGYGGGGGGSSGDGNCDR